MPEGFLSDNPSLSEILFLLAVALCLWVIYWNSLNFLQAVTADETNRPLEG